VSHDFHVMSCASSLCAPHGGDTNAGIGCNLNHQLTHVKTALP